MATNPFRYGEVATGAFFTNRTSELTEVQNDIRNGQNMVIISPRRYGKTSLIFEAMELLRHDAVLVAYLDLFRTPTKDRFADGLAAAIYSGLVAPLERVWQNAVQLFQKLPIKPTVTINEDGHPSFEFSPGPRARDIDRTIEELLSLPGQIARHRGRRVAFVFDEFQQVLDIDSHLPGLMRAVFQLQGEVAHVFMGSKRHLMRQVFTDQNQPPYKLAKPMVLHPINAVDFGAFIRARCATTGQDIDDAAIARILAVTGGHPHDTQELCYFTWALAQAAPAGIITANLVDAALTQVLDAESAHYTTLWEDLSAHQRLVLMALSEDPGPVYSEDYRRRHRLGSPSSVQRSVERLSRRDLIELSPGSGYDMPDVFLRAWIARSAVP